MTDVNVKDLIVRFWTSVHEGVFRATDGRILNRVLGMPVLQLTTIGRRSGVPRAVMLTAPVCEAGHLVLVASNAGDHRHPAWYLNLLANPAVSVTMDGDRWSARVRPATPQERAELWPRIVAANPGYGQYQAKTARQIGLVIVPRAAASTPGEVSPARTNGRGRGKGTDR